MSKCDPRAPFDISLDMFDGMDDKPTFTYRRVSAAEFDRMADEWESIKLLNDTKASNAKIIELAEVGLIGWANQINVETGSPVSYPAPLRSVVNHIEADELIGKRMKAATLSLEDKKKSVLPASSAGGNSAASVNPVAA